MELKDYYKILELPPSATLKEIKAAYRRLAHQFHPDKSNNDLYASAQFKIIKEAYEVLTDPVKKDVYLQDRWYNKSVNKKGSTSPTTPVTILRKVLILDRQISQLDVYRMDGLAIKEQIEEALSVENVEILNYFNETEVNHSIIRTMARGIRILPHSMSRELATTLDRINAEPHVKDLIFVSLKSSQRDATWNKLHPWIVIMIVVLICLLIYGITA